MYIVDTNVLLSYPKVLERKDIAITIESLKELDGLKKNPNPETAYNSRRASRIIYSKSDEIEFLEYPTSLNTATTVDDKIIELAQIHGYGVLSNDINVLIKCRFRDVECSCCEDEEDFYDGIRVEEITLDTLSYNKEVDDILDSRIPPFSMKENEFLVYKDKDSKEDYTILRNKKNKLELLEQNKPFQTSYMGKILPKNTEQQCLFNLLHDDTVKIILAKGYYGSGKSISSISAALHMVEKGKKDKIIWVPNNSFTKDTREIGALPGSLYEKELIFMGTLVDLIGEMNIVRMMEEGKLEIVPISIMRGRNFNNSIILVNEAQNLTEEHIKLLIGRCGEGTRIFFDGDIKQTDSHTFKNKNGLSLLLKLANSPIYGRIFGTVTLKTIERSFTAQAADYLDSLS